MAQRIPRDDFRKFLRFVFIEDEESSVNFRIDFPFSSAVEMMLFGSELSGTNLGREIMTVFEDVRQLRLRDKERAKRSNYKLRSIYNLSTSVLNGNKLIVGNTYRSQEFRGKDAWIRNVRSLRSFDVISVNLDAFGLDIEHYFFILKDGHTVWGIDFSPDGDTALFKKARAIDLIDNHAVWRVYFFMRGSYELRSVGTILYILCQIIGESGLYDLRSFNCESAINIIL
jgi:hypothetical protein